MLNRQELCSAAYAGTRMLLVNLNDINCRHESIGTRTECESGLIEGSKKSLACSIRKKFMGANISTNLVNGNNVNGEVVFDSDDILAQKSGDVINFINPNYIVSFQ